MEAQKEGVSILMRRRCLSFGRIDQFFFNEPMSFIETFRFGRIWRANIFRFLLLTSLPILGNTRNR